MRREHNCTAQVLHQAWGWSAEKQFERDPFNPLHFLPGYAPDLNPDELVWSYAKCTDVARKPLMKGEKLQGRVHEQLQEIGNNPKLVRSFFKHPSVAYISDL